MHPRPSLSEKPSAPLSSPLVLALAHTPSTERPGENPFESPSLEEKEAYSSDQEQDDAASIMSRRAERRFLRKLDVLRELAVRSWLSCRHGVGMLER
jgi:hypothetical protein